MVDRALLGFIGNTRKYIYQAVGFKCLNLIANIVFSYNFASILIYFLKGIFIIKFEISIFMIVVSLAVRQYCIRKVSMKNSLVVYEVKQNLRQEVYEKVLSMGTLFQEEMTTQEIVHLGVEGVEQLENYYGSYLTQFYYSFASAIILVVVMYPLNMWVALALLGASPLIPGFLYVILVMVKNVQRKYWSKYADVGNLFLDSLQGLTTLKVFKADEDRGTELDEMSEGFRKQTMKLLSMQLNTIMIIDWFAYGGSVLAILVALIQFKVGNIYSYELVVILLLIAEFFVPMRTLTGMFHVAMTGVTAGEKMLDFLYSDELVKRGNEKYPINAKIELKNMDFSYPDGECALKGVNMEFAPGEMVAIIGESGSGKSTLASVIAGEYRQPSGSIFIDNKDILEIDAYELNKNIIRITHDGHVFQGSVRENLLIGNFKATDDELISILEKVRLWDLFEQMDGLDTKILSQGKNISGGQAQRLSLARALIYDAEVYIFDEATSNIDVESEQIITDIIKSISKKKTVIYISHRLKSVENIQKIYVLEKGLLIESGNHCELMELGGKYRFLYDKQDELERFRQSSKEGEKYEKK